MTKRIIYNKGDKIGKCLFVEDVVIMPRRVALFICDCGKEFKARIEDIKRGVGCGCKRVGPLKHGHTRNYKRSVEFESWAHMIKRCTNPNYCSYKNYGGRGISICDRWLGENGFVNFLSDMGNRPTIKHSLDRFPDNNGNYEPANCRWATQKEQCRNVRTNVMLSYKGDVLCMSEMAEKYGLTPAALRARIFVNNWSIEKAISTPIRRKIA